MAQVRPCARPGRRPSSCSTSAPPAVSSTVRSPSTSASKRSPTPGWTVSETAAAPSPAGGRVLEADLGDAVAELARRPAASPPGARTRRRRRGRSRSRRARRPRPSKSDPPQPPRQRTAKPAGSSAGAHGRTRKQQGPRASRRGAPVRVPLRSLAGARGLLVALADGVDHVADQAGDRAADARVAIAPMITATMSRMPMYSAAVWPRSSRAARRALPTCAARVRADAQLAEVSWVRLVRSACCAPCWSG